MPGKISVWRCVAVYFHFLYRLSFKYPIYSSKLFYYFLGLAQPLKGGSRVMRLSRKIFTSLRRAIIVVISFGVYLELLEWYVRVSSVQPMMFLQLFSSISSINFSLINQITNPISVKSSPFLRQYTCDNIDISNYSYWVIIFNKDIYLSVFLQNSFKS